MRHSATQIKDEISNLRDEVALLRSAIISFLGEDREGRYRPEFVKQVFKSAKEKPDFAFHDARAFLKQLKNF